jgi:hypothetical protein
MTGRQMTPADLEAVLKAQAAAPPDKESELLVRHLQCKETLALTEAVAAAISRNYRQDSRALLPPSEILPLFCSHTGSAICAGASFARRAAH